MNNINWTEKRLKYLFKKRMGGAWGDEPYEGNSVVCIRAADFETEKLKHKITDLTRRSFKEDELISKSLQPGDIIIEKSGGGENQPVGRVVLFSLDEPALCSNFLEILRPKKEIIFPQFAVYLLYSLWNSRVTSVAIKQTTGIQNLDVSDYLDLKVFLPDIDQQIKIVKSLNSEISYIDKLLQAKGDLLKILFEKRKTLVTKTITRGTNPRIRLKDSGVEWLGEIPEHWEVERTKWLFKERNERSTTGEEELLTVSHITGVTLRSEKDVNMFEAETTEGHKKCYKNDLVINTLWAWMGAMGVSPLDGVISPAYHVYTPNERILPKFVDAIVRLPIFASEVTKYSKGVWSSRLRLYPEGLYEVYFPVPPIDEQLEIIRHIGLELKKMDNLIIATEKSITLLKERRAVLITEAIITNRT